jgi:SulP family sulfate permease
MTSALASSLHAIAGPLETARHYSLRKFRRDLVAGLTVSVVEVPQAMAYAIIAGVPPVYGIYTSILQGIMCSLLSSSEHMTTGPTNTQSLLIASAIKGVLGPDADPMLYLQLVFALTMLKGLIQLAFAAANLGDMVRYVSRSVIIGLVAGAGVLIFVGQLPAFLGITVTHQSMLWGVPGKLDALLHHLHETNWRAIAVGITVLLIVAVVRAVSKLLPGALLGIVISAIAV